MSLRPLACLEYSLGKKTKRNAINVEQVLTSLVHRYSYIKKKKNRYLQAVNGNTSAIGWFSKNTFKEKIDNFIVLKTSNTLLLKG